MKTKKMMINAIVAALYIAVTLVVAPLSYGAIQFRLSEIFNHLAIFNKNYIIGIGAGVFIANLFSPLGWYDIVFGLAHTLVSLLILTILTKHVSNKWIKMTVNTLLFAVFSFIIAWELKLAFNAPFWLNYGFVAIGEMVVMGIGMPLMKYIDEKIQFSQYMNV